MMWVVPLLLVVLLASGLGLAYVVGGAAVVSFILTENERYLAILPQKVFSQISVFALLSMPLFILAGNIMAKGGMALRLVRLVKALTGPVPGGLAIATIGADELFAAICGSNTATAATMGAVALPQMEKYNYDTRLSSGAGVTGGTLGTVMPPSVVLIIIGLQTEQSIVKLCRHSVNYGFESFPVI